MCSPTYTRVHIIHIYAINSPVRTQCGLNSCKYTHILTQMKKYMELPVLYQLQKLKLRLIHWTQATDMTHMTSDSSLTNFSVGNTSSLYHPAVSNRPGISESVMLTWLAAAQSHKGYSHPHKLDWLVLNSSRLAKQQVGSLFFRKDRPIEGKLLAQLYVSGK